MKYAACLALLMMMGRVWAETPITAIARTVEGKHVVFGSQLGIEIRELPELTVVGRLATELELVHDLKFSPDGKRLLAAGGSAAESGRVEVWNWLNRERLREVRVHDDVVYQVAWSTDGKQWLTCSGDGTCSIFSEMNNVRLTHYEGHSRGVLAGAFLDDLTVASAGIDQTIRLWKSADGSHQRTLDNHVGAINDVAVQPTSVEQTVVLASVSEDRTLRLWQPRIGRLIRFVKLASVPRCLDWSSDGTKIYVGCNDGQVRVVDGETMQVESEIDGLVGRIHDLVVDSAGNCILTAGATGCQRIKLPKD